MKYLIVAGLYGKLQEHFGFTGVPLMLGLMAVVLLCAAGGYFAGSLNSAVLVSRGLYGKDIRSFGSGNAGMTNMFRVLGKKAGLLTLLGDMLKTLVSVGFGCLIYGYAGAYIAGLFCVLGHVFPCYYRFRGGKGVLVTAVMLLALNPLVFGSCFLVFAIVLLGTRMVSMASVMSALMMPLFQYEWHTALVGDGAAAGIRSPILICVMLIIVFRHMANLKRIYHGKEPKITFPWTRDDKNGQAETSDPSETRVGKKGKKKNKK